MEFIIKAVVVELVDLFKIIIDLIPKTLVIYCSIFLNTTFLILNFQTKRLLLNKKYKYGGNLFNIYTSLINSSLSITDLWSTIRIYNIFILCLFLEYVYFILFIFLISIIAFETIFIFLLIFNTLDNILLNQYYQYYLSYLHYLIIFNIIIPLLNFLKKNKVGILIKWLNNKAIKTT